MRFLVLVAVFAVAHAKHEQYIGWKSYFVGPSTVEQAKAVNSLIGPLELDFLSPALVQREGVVLVKPQYQEIFTETLNKLGVSFRIHADDIKAKLDYDDELIEDWRRQSITRGVSGLMPYDNYQPLSVIESYMEDIAARFPETTTLASAGNSFEGRPIKYMKISTTNFTNTNKPIIFIDSAIHAREWITPPAVTWAIRKLTEDVDEPDLLNNYDWILMPVVNPDGYVFSFEDTRFWRKTRSNNTHTLSTLCPGVDGNRNFDFFWNTVGTSDNPCSDIYAGDRPFSEVETQALRDLLDEHLARIALYITVHSFGSMVLYPWGHNGTLSLNALDLHTVGVSMSDAIYEVKLPHFPRYLVGNSAVVLNYAAAGAGEDYAHSIGVPLTYTFELPGLDSGLQGFNLNPRYIEQVSRETWHAFAVGARKAASSAGTQVKHNSLKTWIPLVIFTNILMNNLFRVPK